MSQKALIKATSLGEGHHIPFETIKKITKAMKEPYLILKSSKENSLLEVLMLKDDLEN